MSSFNEFSLQAKVIVLGDPKVGKSSLIHNLDPQARTGPRAEDGFEAENIIFSVVEFPVSELTDSNNDSSWDCSRGGKSRMQTQPGHKPSGPSVFLKIWEYSQGLSKEEEELAFRGALFCIVVLDLRSPDSAKNVFNKWISMKEKNMNECFLFVVGTHLDQIIQRRVDIAEMCKACAQKEAIYTELSNYDGTNLSLLRRLMAQRINYVLSIRESVSHSGINDMDFDKDLQNQFEQEDYSEEAKIQEHEKVMQSLEGPLSAPFFEQDLLCDSVGSILASALGTEYWPGFEAEEEHLMQIGKTLTGFLDKLTTDPKSLPKAPLDNSLLSPNENSIWSVGGGVEGNDLYGIPEPSIDELQHVFEVMGFALPRTLSSSATVALTEAQKEGNGDESSRNPGDSSRAPNLQPKLVANSSNSSSPGKKASQSNQTKLRIRLPDGSTGAMIVYPGYDIADQVDAFMMQYGMEDDKQSREKLIEAARRSVAAVPSTSLASAATSSPLSSPDAKPNTNTSTKRPSVASPNNEDISELLSSSPNPSRRKSNLVLNSSDATNQNASQSINKGREVSSQNPSISSPPPTTGGGLSKTPMRAPLMVPPSTTSHAKMNTSLSSSQNIRDRKGTGTPAAKIKKCKVRIQLPDFAGGAIETVVREGQDLMEVSKAIALEHNLSLGYQQKVYDQLRNAFKR